MSTYNTETTFDNGLGQFKIDPNVFFSDINDPDVRAGTLSNYQTQNQITPTGVFTASDGKTFSTEAEKNDWEKFLYQKSLDAKAAEDKIAAEKANRISAWQVLQSEFSRYGLGDLVGVLKDSLIQGASREEQLLLLRQSDVYKQRFAANEIRIANGLRELSEAEYIGLEDQYANVMRRYGLPDWYTQLGSNGKQTNLEQFIANDVSPAELEDRVQLAVNRIQNGPKEVMDALQKFYPEINSGDVLAFMLDPKKSMPMLQRKVQAAEIGGEALRYGLGTDVTRAEELASLGVGQEAARQGFQTIAGGLERGSQLASIYGTNYDQNTAEQEVFGMEGSTDANKKRRKIIGLEQAAFGGSSGVRGGALDANRAGAF